MATREGEPGEGVDAEEGGAGGGQQLEAEAVEPEPGEDQTAPIQAEEPL